MFNNAIVYHWNSQDTFRHRGTTAAISTKLILQKCRVKPNEGITESSVHWRRKRYGSHDIDPALIYGYRTLWDYVRNAIRFTFLNDVAALVVLVYVVIVTCVFGPDSKRYTRDGVYAILFLLFDAGLNMGLELRADYSSVHRKRKTTLVKVCRDGVTKRVCSTDLVVGDIVLFQRGDAVPADCVGLSSIGSMVLDECCMTGETYPTHIDEGGFMAQGTNVINGNGEAVVMAVGMNTMMSQIFTSFDEVHCGFNVDSLKIPRCIHLWSLVFGVATAITGCVCFYFNGDAGTDGGYCNAVLTGLMTFFLLQVRMDSVYVDDVVREDEHGVIGTVISICKR
eukprot:PhF_6_TR25127/c0_g1_i3/m.34568/K01537/E3.6.3.8; Ca2+-transporting ATPase